MTTIRNQPSIEKLPKWAQDKIQILENEVKRLGEQLANEGKGEATNFYLANAIDGITRYVSKLERVEFHYDPKEPFRNISLRLTDDGKGLILNGSSTVLVRPHAANSVSIYPAER